MKEGPRFLFAVVRDVQRNIVMFVRDLDGHEFLFAVVRDVQRNFKQVYTDQLVACPFLFAVVRDVQRNRRPQRRVRRPRVSIRCRARRTAEPRIT